MMSSQNLKKKLCKFQNNCLYKDTCTYYHPEEDKVQKRLCRFRENCRDKNCNYRHPEDELTEQLSKMHLVVSKNFIQYDKEEKVQELSTLSTLSTLTTLTTSRPNNVITVKDVNTHNDDELLKKTKLCSYYKVGCMHKDNCTYAHSKEELRPIICKSKYRYVCRTKDCPYYHDGDIIPTIDELFEKALKTTKIYETPKEKKVKKEVSDEKFIIYFSSDDEEEGEKPKKEEKKEENEEKTTRFKFDVDISLHEMLDLITYLNNKKIKIVSFNSDFHN